MNKSTKFSPDVRVRAMRMVREHQGDSPSLWAAVESIAPKIGCVPQTLLEWVKREEVDERSLTAIENFFRNLKREEVDERSLTAIENFFRNLR